MEPKDSIGDRDSRLLAVLPHLGNVKKLVSKDPKLQKLFTMKISLLFESLEQSPTPATLKQLRTQTGFTKFVDALVLSEAAQAVLREHPVSPSYLVETDSIVECAAKGNHELFHELLSKVPEDFLNRFETETGLSLLHIAAQAGNLPIIKYILATGFPIDQQSKLPGVPKRTPLMEAVRSEKLKAVQLLLTYGAQLPKLRCAENKSVTDYASEQMKHKIREHVLALRAGKIEIPTLVRMSPIIPQVQIPVPAEAPVMAAKGQSNAALSAARNHPVSPQQYPQASPTHPAMGPLHVVGSLPGIPSHLQPYSGYPHEFMPHDPLSRPPGFAYPIAMSPQGPIPYGAPGRGAGMAWGPQGPIVARPVLAHHAPIHPPHVPQTHLPPPASHVHAQAPVTHTGPKQANRQTNSKGPSGHTAATKAPTSGDPKRKGDSRKPSKVKAVEPAPPATKEDARANFLERAFQSGVPTQPGTKPPEIMTKARPNSVSEAPAPNSTATQPTHSNLGPPMAAVSLPPGLPQPQYPTHSELVHGQSVSMAPMGGIVNAFGNGPFMDHYNIPDAFQHMRMARAMPHSTEIPMGATETAPPRVHFAGSEDLYAAHPYLENIPISKLVHELWNMVERSEEEQQQLKQQVLQLQSAPSTIKWSLKPSAATECSVCWEENEACMVMIPCGHFIPCQNCTKKNPKLSKECSICSSRCTDSIRIYFGAEI